MPRSPLTLSTLFVFLAGCATTPPEPQPIASMDNAPPRTTMKAENARERTASQGDGLLRNPSTGVVALHVPPAILADLQAQMRRAGRSDLADEVARAYDLESGDARGAR